MSTITTEKAREVASAAVDEGKHLAEAALAQMSEKSQAPREHLAETLRGFGDSIEEMASRSDLPDRAADAVQLVADRTRGLSTRLDGGKPRRLRRLGRFVRNHRVAVLLGALGAGAVAVRLGRKPTMASTSPSMSAPATRSTETPPGQHMAPMDVRADDIAWVHSGQPPLP